MQKTSIQTAIDILSVRELSRILGVSVTMIYRYKYQKYVTADYHLLIHEATNGKVSDKMLLKDLVRYKGHFKPKVKNLQPHKTSEKQPKDCYKTQKKAAK